MMCTNNNRHQQGKQPQKYYAVRQGRTVKSCVFIFWSDCKEQVEGCKNAEYSVFDDLNAAAEFVIPPNTSENAVHLPLGESKDFNLISDTSLAGPNLDGYKLAEKTKLSVENSAKTNLKTNYSRETENIAAGDHPVATKENTVKILNHNPTLSVEKVNNGRDDGRKLSNIVLQEDWMEGYRQLEAYVQEHGNSKINPEDTGTKHIFAFIHEQIKMVKTYCDKLSEPDGKIDRLRQEQIRLLRAINFDFEITLPDVVIENLIKPYQHSATDTAKTKNENELSPTRVATVLSLGLVPSGNDTHVPMTENLSSTEKRKREKFIDEANKRQKTHTIVQGKNSVKKKSIRRDWMEKYHQLKLHFDEFGTSDVANSGNIELDAFLRNQKYLWRKYFDGLTKHGEEIDHCMQEKMKLLQAVNFDFEMQVPDVAKKNVCNQDSAHVSNLDLTKNYSDFPKEDTPILSLVNKCFSDTSKLPIVENHVTKHKNRSFDQSKLKLPECEINDASLDKYTGLTGSLKKIVNYYFPSTRPPLKKESSSKDFCTLANQKASSESNEQKLSVEIESQQNRSNDTQKTKIPQRKWLDKYNQLKSIIDQNGEFTINSFDDSSKPLLAWIKYQRHIYKKYCEDLQNPDKKVDHMVVEKIKLLKAINFTFEKKVPDDGIQKSPQNKIRVNWMKKYEILKSLYDEHGCITIDSQDTSTLSFVEQQKVMYKSFINQLSNFDKKNDMVSEEKIKLLKAINFDFNSESNEDKWEAMYDKMKIYREKNGDCALTSACRNQDTKLYNWALKQRINYKALRSGKPSPLKASQILKLSDLGFNFETRSPYLSFEERLEQLHVYKKIHSHVNVSEDDPILGKFVNKQRNDYTKFMRGEKSPMNEMRIKKLTEMGFVFQPGKRSNLDRSKFKSWDERFEQLLEYKRKHGNTRVPHNFADDKTFASWTKKVSFLVDLFN